MHAKRRGSPACGWDPRREPHGVNLFGHDHRAKFAGHGRSIAAGDHDAVSTGPNSRIIVWKRIAGNRRGSELRQRSRRLKRQHAACEKPGHKHNGRRAHADDIALQQEVGPVARRAHKIRHGANREQE